MTPEPFGHANTLLKAPEGWDAETMGPCYDVPAFVGQGLVMTVWRPSLEELALLLGGGCILLTMAGVALPAVQLEAIHTADAEAGMHKA